MNVCSVVSMVSIEDVPVKILRINTRKIISDLLNSKKIFQTADNLCRDWRGLAHLCGVIITNQSNPPPDPTDFVLLKWQQQERATINQFLDFLGRLDRYDVIADTEDLIQKDVERYLHLKDSVAVRVKDEEIVTEHDEQVLTIDDVCRIEKGLGPQKYDAFVLYAEEEWDGTQVLVNQLESKNFKLCLKDRDIVAGVSFEHKAIMTLIEERCFRLIVMLSPKFVESSSNKFLHLFAQSVQIEKQMRKVIPCIYKKFPSADDIPSEFKCYKVLKYDDMNRWPEMFWCQLMNSIKTPQYNARIKEIEQIKSTLPALCNDQQSILQSTSIDLDRILPSAPTHDICEQSSSDTIKKFDNVNSNGIHSEDNIKEETIYSSNNKKNALLSEMRCIFRDFTKKFSSSKNKRKKGNQFKCPVMA